MLVPGLGADAEARGRQIDNLVEIAGIAVVDLDAHTSRAEMTRAAMAPRVGALPA